MDEATSKHGGARVRVPPPLVFLASIGVGVGLRYVVAPPPLPFARVMHVIVGALLFVVGLALGMPAFGLFKRSGQDPAPWKPSPSLVLQGPYRYTRNPMYIGMTLIQIAIGFFAANLWVVLLAAASLIVVHYTAVLPEERYLREKFGDDYERFKKRVRRYL